MTAFGKVTGGSAALGSGSLLGRVVAVFVLVLVISNVFVAVFEAGRNRDLLLDLSLDILESETRSIGRQVAEGQRERRAVLTSVFRSVDFTEAVERQDRGRLNRIALALQDRPVFDAVGVITAEGLQVPAPGVDTPMIPVQALDRLDAGLVVHDGAGRPYLITAPRPLRGATLYGGVRLDGQAARELLRDVDAPGQLMIVVDGVPVVQTFPSLGGGAEPLSTTLPGWRDGEPAPRGQVAVLAEQSVLVNWVRIADSVAGTGVGVGLVIPDPLDGLRVELVRNRLLSSALLATIGVLLSLILLRLVTRPVSELTRAARRISDGDLDHDFGQVSGAAEIEGLAGALDRMVVTLRSNTATIERQARALREATKRIVRTRDDERHRMASTLHDGFQQRLVVLRMKVSALTEQTLREQQRELADDVLSLLTDLRRLSHDLYPSILRDRGLGGALHSLVGGLTADISLELGPQPFPRLPLDIEANAYFLISEGVANALKHAEGASVHVFARVFETELELSVIDEGPGFELHARRGVGLTGFEDRAEAVGGTCLVISDHNGTWIVARVPLPPDPDRPFESRWVHETIWEEVLRWQRDCEEREAGRPVSSVTPLQEQQHGRDTTVEVGRVVEPKLREDGVGVFLDRSLRDDE